jgi:hypothetical protein
VATKPRNIIPATALALSFGAIAIAWCGAAEAKTGLVPVVAEGELGLKMAQKVERAAIKALMRNGVNPPRPAALLPHLDLASPTDPPTTAQCVAAGEALNLDIVVVIRVRPWADAVETEMRVVVVETRKEYLYAVHEDAAYMPREVGELVADVFGNIRAWNADLIDVEHAQGRDEDKLYGRYLGDAGPQASTFAQYAYDRAERGRNVSLGLGIAIPTILAAATVWFGIATRGVWENRIADPGDSEYGVIIWFADMAIIAARVIVVLVLVVGAAATAVSVAISTLMYKRHEKEMNRLSTLVSGASAEPPPVSWNVAPYLSPEGGGLALDLQF